APSWYQIEEALVLPAILDVIDHRIDHLSTVEGRCTPLKRVRDPSPAPVLRLAHFGATLPLSDWVDGRPLVGRDHVPPPYPHGHPFYTVRPRHATARIR